VPRENHMICQGGHGGQSPKDEAQVVFSVFFNGGENVMCEANAYLRKQGEQDELLLEMVDRVVPHEEGLMLEDIFGRRKILKAKIVELALVEHKIILEKE